MIFAVFIFGVNIIPLALGILQSGNEFRLAGNEKPLLQPSPSFEQYFDQKLDHFNNNDPRTWDQLYYSDDEYYEKGGPVYLWIEGKYPANRHWLTQGYWQSHGKEKKAMLFLLEHRFYGNILPLANTSYANLHYLKATQAVEDIAKFIEGMQQQHEFSNGTKWIVFGAGYGGNLAAWVRAKYPNLVHGAVASSSPVQAQLEFPKYLDNVADAIASHNKKCISEIALANKQMDDMVQSEEGKAEIGNYFRLCQPLKGTHMNVSFFMVNVVDYISRAVQYEYEGANVAAICEKMMRDSDKKKAVQRYGEVIDSLMHKANFRCLSTNYTSFAYNLKKEDALSSIVTHRTWVYQLCTEFGWFQVAGKRSKTFSQNINLDFFLTMCSDVFHRSINKKSLRKAVSVTNKSFSGLKINSPRILFVHGSIDPWRSLGVLSTKKNKNLDIIVIKDGSHSSELQTDEIDNQMLEDAKKEIMNKLDSWLE